MKSLLETFHRNRKRQGTIKTKAVVPDRFIIKAVCKVK